MTVKFEALRRATRFVTSGILFIAISGCTTYYGAAVLQSEPSGAQIYDMEDGSYIGVTTVKHVWLSRDTQRKFMNVRLQKDGYADAISSFWLNLDYTSPKAANQHPQFVEFELVESAP